MNTAGEVIAEMRYTAWGEVRYQGGSMPTDRTYTGQRSYASDFGLMFYNARWYDSSLSRFAQADTVVPGGVQGYDRYAYTSNNPMNRTDPTGHKEVCTDQWDSAQSKAVHECHDDGTDYIENATTTLILICGDDMKNSCQPLGGNYSDWRYPNNQQPLTPEAAWAQRNHIPYVYVGTGSGSTDALSEQITQFMSKTLGINPDMHFTFIGFSGGAGFAPKVVQDTLAKGLVPASSMKIIELDGAMNSSANTLTGITALRNQGVGYFAFHSQSYATQQDHYNQSFGIKGLQLPPSSVLTTAQTHQDLAVDPNIFAQYIEPLLP